MFQNLGLMTELSEELYRLSALSAWSYVRRLARTHLQRRPIQDANRAVLERQHTLARQRHQRLIAALA